MEEKKDRQDGVQEQDADQEPQVYNVKKGVGGWEFSRRKLLAAAAAATAVTAAAVSKKDGRQVSTTGRKDGGQPSIALEIATTAMLSVVPAQRFVQIWRLANKGDGNSVEGAKLSLADAEWIRSPASVAVPQIAPGQSVAVHAPLVAPTKAGVHRGSWQLQIAEDGEPIAIVPFVIQDGCIIESPHPYENNSTLTWTVTNPDENARYTRVHFSQVDLDLGDYIILKDEAGTEQQRIIFPAPSGLWSDLIPGRVVNVELITDAIGTAWGFCLDQVETIHLVFLPIVSKAATPTPTPCSCDIVCSCDADYCTCDILCSCHTDYCSCDTYYSHYWYPC